MLRLNRLLKPTGALAALGFLAASAPAWAADYAPIDCGKRKWLKERNACGEDTTCLARAYQSRIDALSAVLDTVASRGPF